MQQIFCRYKLKQLKLSAGQNARDILVNVIAERRFAAKDRDVYAVAAASAVVSLDPGLTIAKIL